MQLRIPVTATLMIAMLVAAHAFRNLVGRRYPAACRLTQSMTMASKTYLNVPFDDKDEVKKRGGRWDTEAKKWYVEEGAALGDFAQWVVGATVVPGGDKGVTWLKVPFSDKDDVRALGAKWDKDKKKWFLSPGTPLGAFSKWVDVKKPSTAKASPVHKTSSWGTPQVSSNGRAVTSSKVPPATAKPQTTPLPSKGILFLDIETNGLPVTSKGAYPPPSDLSAYEAARVVKVSASLCDIRTLKETDAFSLIVKPDGFTINNSEFHGVTEEIARKRGVAFDAVSEKLQHMLQNCVAVTAHNAAFDVAVLASEIHRRGSTALAERLLSVKALCTMELTKEAVGLKDVRGKPKNPNMRELYSYAMGEAKAGAVSDLEVQQLREAFVALVDRGVVPRPLLDDL